MKNINNYISQLIDIKDKKANKCLCDYVENIIFNITSIAAIIAFINNSKSVNKRNIELVSSYIKTACGKIIGGNGATVLPSEFYGIDSSRYLPTNNNIDILNIDFTSGLLRPQIGGAKIKNPIPDAIEEVLSNYKLTISIDNCKKLTKIIENYLHCLINKIKNNKKQITTASIKKLVTSNKTFNIFK